MRPGRAEANRTILSEMSVAVGQRFREARATIFGEPAPEWIVEHLRIGSDGLEYATLVSAADPSLRKTLSTAVLVDRQRFVPVDRN